MSNFDQKNQIVTTQINVANSSNSYANLWITAAGEERYFLSLISKPEETGSEIWNFILAASKVVQGIELIKDPDFNVLIDNKYVDGISVGEIKKFNIMPGDHTIEIQLNLTEYRQRMGAGIVDAIISIFNSNTNRISFPANPGETIDLVYEKSNLRFRR